MKKKTFVTLFNCENVHLIKDVGLIPYGMNKYFSYESFIASYNNGEYSYLNSEIEGVKIFYIKKITGNYAFDSCIWLIKNANKIDVLNLYHQGYITFIRSVIYKIFNRKGKIFYKLDGGKLYRQINSGLRKWVYKKTMHMANLVSSEIEKQSRLLEKEWGEKVVFIPNPVHSRYIVQNIDYAKRKNIILTVGRLGSEQKATDVLLEAFAKVAKSINYDLVCVGGIETKECNFIEYIDKYFLKYPHLKNRIIFTGNVSDRNELMSYYRNAKIFAFPSRYESYGMALSEAICNGDFLIVSNIPSSKEMSYNFKYVGVHEVDSVDGLAEELKKWCSVENETVIESHAKKLFNQYVKQHLLKNICAEINKGLNF